MDARWRFRERLMILLVVVFTLIAVYRFTAPWRVAAAVKDEPRLVVAPADQARFAGHMGPEPLYHEPSAGELRATVLDEAHLIYFQLRVATGEFTCEGKLDCVVEEDFPEVVHGIVDRCHRVDTAALRRADPALLGTLAADWDAACGPLVSAAAREGRPRETPEWKQRVVEARTIFQRLSGGV